MSQQTIDELTAAADAFATPLRMRDGFDRAAFERLCAALRRCAVEWAGSGSLPKRVVMELIDLWPAVQACAELYRGAEAEKILHAADTLADLSRAVAAEGS